MGALMSSYQRQAFCRLMLSLIIPDRITRRILPGTPPISTLGPFRSRKTHCLETSNALHVYLVSSCDKRRMKINTLPDDVLLLIFHFDRLIYLDRPEVDSEWCLFWKWHRLVHVCRRWRSVVFRSPNSLDLRLVCGPSTPVKLTGIWPPLPIIIRGRSKWDLSGRSRWDPRFGLPIYDLSGPGRSRWDPCFGLPIYDLSGYPVHSATGDITASDMPEDYDFPAAIVHPSRVHEIRLFNLSSWHLQDLASAMQEQFPALKHLGLSPVIILSRQVLALPDGFLGGSAPRLQSLTLYCILFPALPKLLLSTTDLVHLNLRFIPHSGYFSPKAFATTLAMLVNLKYLALKFQSPLSRPDRESRLLPLPTRTVLPALTRFEFKGVSEYLEDIVTRIDAPFLDSICITFFNQLIFNIPHLAQFLRRTKRFQALNETHVDLDFASIQVGYLPPTWVFGETSGLRISCKRLDWQLSSLAQIFTSFFPSIYMVERLFVYGPEYIPSHWEGDIENMEWLEILHLFVAVKNLYISEKLRECTTPALKELVEGRFADALPALENVFLEDFDPYGCDEEAIRQFVAARQLLGRPVAISRWKRERRF